MSQTRMVTLRPITFAFWTILQASCAPLWRASLVAPVCGGEQWEAQAAIAAQFGRRQSVADQYDELSFHPYRFYNRSRD